MVVSCIDYGLLVTGMYIVAIWANMVLRSEDNTETAEAVTARSLRIMFEIRGCTTHKIRFPAGQWLDILIDAYLCILEVWDEVKAIAGLPAKG